jgi:hypothetical protein
MLLIRARNASEVQKLFLEPLTRCKIMSHRPVLVFYKNYGGERKREGEWEWAKESEGGVVESPRTIEIREIFKLNLFSLFVGRVEK